ncbi:hypothetical protein JX265_013849 [Neoarthrinium moseri]|uniref:HAUS augmin-like complex subunit 1 n=1 Tax=Neoarthrinium moseri TaxID=1658444 RepID=A0A9P9W7W2_9PEZI|nr:uncharacterized protein JN550_013218 [Neoarthrinium moseri]KAI1839843.1 hypothetical protein JX266_013948 [Neoarthrinium moseri]KAI1848293.1 hypothetical protein JX265_013849 [Neoarthrinium moseri]KAI1857400.1 hypothetical protein JN550_013218 [Neoarthrinium moseri]
MPAQAPQTAIFSPSVARAAASTAKDWSYVDGWLKSKYQGRPVPSFERNADTLKALLALAAHNEAADEDRDQLARMEAAALDEVKAARADNATARQAAGAKATEQPPPPDGEHVAADVLEAVENGLTREGRTALESMAGMAVELGMARPTPDELGCKFVELQAKVYELEHTIERVALLQRYLDRESAAMDVFVEDLQGEEYRPPSDLSKQNLDLQRQVKLMSAKLPELAQRVISLEKSVPLPTLTVEAVREDEANYMELLAKKKGLDAQVKAFADLPPDIEAARAELEALRTELRHTTERRDSQFEGLVERESPFKPRRRP